MPRIDPLLHIIFDKPRSSEQPAGFSACSNKICHSIKPSQFMNFEKASPKQHNNFQFSLFKCVCILSSRGVITEPIPFNS